MKIEMNKETSIENRIDGKKTKILGYLIGLFLISVIILYWVFPVNQLDFGADTNDNFSASLDEKMQFYSNMRFPSSTISYTIEKSCSIKKKADMKTAFETLEEITNLTFNPDENGKVKVYCEYNSKSEPVDKGFFIAGEGGPVNATLGKYFNVIHEGEIILIKDSDCENPNVAIHELLHVLGFNHSDNSNNIMYPISKCKQTIGEDIVNKINELYIYPSFPDLEFEHASARMKGRLMDFDVTIKNNGLERAEKFNLVMYANGKEIKKLKSDGIDVGYAQRIEVTNSLVSILKINELKFYIETDFEELNKENNEIILTNIN